MSAESQLPRTADGSRPGTGAAPTGAAPAGAVPTGDGPSKSQLQDEVTRARTELAATVDALSLRMSPSYQAQRVKSVTTTAARDTRALLTGGGMPVGDDRRARNVKVLLAAATAVAVIVTVRLIRRGHR